MKRLYFFSLLSILLLLVQCKSNSSDPAPTNNVAGPSTYRAIWPPATDANISVVYPTPIAGIVLDSHQVYINKTVTAKNKLFVFLPGTGAIPRYYRYILDVAAQQGYHAIGLTYVNPVTVSTLCGSTTNLDCNGNVRYEILDGTDRATEVNISVANSIENRLAKAIAYLNTQYPTENWGQFLTSGSVNWTKVSLAGHSQGGGQTAFIAKVRSLIRATSFSSPSDFNTVVNTLPNWLSQTNTTPLANCYGFTSLNDELAVYSVISLNWQALGYTGLGTTTSVDANVNAPFTAHTLTTATAPRPNITVTTPNHNITVVDVNTPLNADGKPTFAPIWQYMCFP